MKKIVIVIFALCVLSSTPIKEINASELPLGEQIATDLITSGVSVAASLSGNFAVGIGAGILARYIAVYGVAGVKKIIEHFKKHEPRDLGEINLYYVYLLNAKRGLYSSLINIRKASSTIDGTGKLAKILEELSSEILNACKNPDKECDPVSIDESLVNFEFLNVALETDATIDVNRFLAEKEIKATYQYILLMYLDIVIVEQKIIESQFNALVNSFNETFTQLSDNVYISNAEKEYLYQRVTNICFRWIRLRDSRRDALGKSLVHIVDRLNGENDDLDDQIDDYRNNNKSEQSDFKKILTRLLKEMQEMGTEVDAISANPFQTGTALKNYFLAEKTLLLTRDTYFQLKANKLESTEDVSDYHHRLRVLRNHSSNMSIGLLKASKAFLEGDSDGFLQVEGPKHEEEVDRILEECSNDSECVARRMKERESHVSNILLDNFRLTSELFKSTPAMHSIEIASIQQLISLVQLEVIIGHIKVSKVEFELFYKKQKLLKEEIDNNPGLTKIEKDFHRSLVLNTVKKWKLRILQRKYDSHEEFSTLAEKFRNKNLMLVKTIDELRSNNPSIVTQKCEVRFMNRDNKRCKLRLKFRNNLETFKSKNKFFTKIEESVLPEYFYQQI